VAPLYYRGAVSALLVYDITNRTSFEKVKDWVNELNRNIVDEPNPSEGFFLVVSFFFIFGVLVMLVVGNKVDRAEGHRAVEKKDGEAYAASISADHFEVSAKTGEGVEDMFIFICKKLIEAKKLGKALPSLPMMNDPREDIDKDKPVIVENDRPQQDRESGKCCG